jgi:hypothetical protein
VEQEAVRTTIVGGRPPGCGQPIGEIPRGIEVLVKKAAVDLEFKAVLMQRRAAAAEEIGLELQPAEAAMLAAVPAPQLEAIIARTTVPQEYRRAFLGKAAAAMLATFGLATSTGCFMGAQPDRPPTKGIRPDRLQAPTGSRPPTPSELHPPKQTLPSPCREPPVAEGIRPDRPDGK